MPILILFAVFSISVFHSQPLWSLSEQIYRLVINILNKLCFSCCLKCKVCVSTMSGSIKVVACNKINFSGCEYIIFSYILGY